MRLSVNPLGITPEMFAITPSLNERIATLKKRFAGKCEIIFVSKAKSFFNCYSFFVLFRDAIGDWSRSSQPVPRAAAEALGV